MKNLLLIFAFVPFIAFSQISHTSDQSFEQTYENSDLYLEASTNDVNLEEQQETIEYLQIDDLLSNIETSDHTSISFVLLWHKAYLREIKNSNSNDPTFR